MNSLIEKKVLDHGFVKLLNLSGPIRRDAGFAYDARDIDPAKVAKISFNSVNKERQEALDFKLCEYLIGHSHNTPVEMIETWWHMQMPIYIARQLVRHRTATINEVSARYTVLPKTWYIPEKENIGIYPKTVKQGRAMIPWEETSDSQKNLILDFQTSLEESCRSSYEEYLKFSALGIAPELARSFLHVNHYTHWIYKMDLHNLMNFMSLRCDSHAQWEAQQYGNAVYEILKNFLPKSMELFDSYRRKATTQELIALTDALAVLKHYSTSLDNPEESIETVKKFFKRLGVS